MTYDPRHMYEDKSGITHFCDGAQIVPGNVGTYIVWTLCEKMDVPAAQSFKSDYRTADCVDCRRKAGLQL